MQLNKSFEQAVSIIAILATQKTDVPVTAHTIHLRLGSSYTYLRKIIRKLVVAGLVHSSPGNRGGFLLAKKAAEISVLEVVEAIEEKIDTYQSSGLINQVFRDEQHRHFAESGDEKIHEIFKSADQQWQNSLMTVSVADIVAEVLQRTDFATIDWNEESSLELLFET